MAASAWRSALSFGSSRPPSAQRALGAPAAWVRARYSAVSRPVNPVAPKSTMSSAAMASSFLFVHVLVQGEGFDARGLKVDEVGVKKFRRRHRLERLELLPQTLFALRGKQEL